jgi:ferredoxin
MQLHIDEAACTGHGRCYAVDPEQFDADEEGFGKVRDVDISAERARAALRICPEHAIRIRKESVTTEA